MNANPILVLGQASTQLCLCIEQVSRTLSVPAAPQIRINELLGTSHTYLDELNGEENVERVIACLQKLLE